MQKQKNLLKKKGITVQQAIYRIKKQHSISLR